MIGFMNDLTTVTAAIMVEDTTVEAPHGVDPGAAGIGAATQVRQTTWMAFSL